MLQGTGSHVGKTVLTAAFCRLFARRGYRVAPFKAQNMALNAAVTPDGREISRAQALQAQAARTVPRVEMNPILLKPVSEVGTQVVLSGRVRGTMPVSRYHTLRSECWAAVRSAYDTLSREYDLLIIEGAGSPAEVNLRAHDLANMRTAALADAAVLLVADIDRGGALASLVGTMSLLRPAERARVKGFIINKFRGDAALLRPGLEFVARRTRRPVMGVVPYFPWLTLPDEDSVALDTSTALTSPSPHPSPLRGRGQGEGARRLKIAVIRLPHIANFTDLDPLRMEPDVEIRYVRPGASLNGADLVILPGNKTTVEDLHALWRSGLATQIIAHARRKGAVIGLCGGFQMLGRQVSDPHGVESAMASVRGLDLLPIETVMAREKVTAQVKARPGAALAAVPVPGPEDDITGYEIHMGRTRYRGTPQPAFTITERAGRSVTEADGAISPDGLVWGTYLHDLFGHDSFRTAVLNRLRAGKGLPRFSQARAVPYRDAVERMLDRLADEVETHLDWSRIARLI